ncbi:haloacid dehalogenase-like hydrolase domain-containing protein 3 isoform X2 [Rhineura floridana]|nr:haloacid dehalogenase-like hydrolase domain-containing protein 3 isoform X2 [Rhineura floridana]XP_061459603.1 haloacid dehalogenase-like hydrolase domain-containing protein 3 isoform X2 [Rhineura floridana]
MLKLRLLTWDVKDTLLRLRFPVGERYSAEARACGLQVEVKMLNQSFQQAHKAHSACFPNYGKGRGLSSKQWWLDVILETFRLSGVHDEGAVRPIAEKLYGEYSTAGNWELLPGARETLQHCQWMGIPMAVVSNFDRRLQETLTQCNLHQHFEFVLSSEEAGFTKPDQRIFLKALCIAGVSPELAAHVGDDYVNDYKAAREAGMHSFLLKTAGQPSAWDAQVPKAHVLQSLTHLLPLIEKG